MAAWFQYSDNTTNNLLCSTCLEKLYPTSPIMQPIEYLKALPVW